MSASKVLLPLRVPELGPYLGKIVSGTGRDEGEIPLAPIRLRLATRIIQCGGEARRLSAREERMAAVEAIGPASWQDAWAEASDAVGTLLLDAIDRRLHEEAAAVGMRERRLRTFLPSPDERADIRSRFRSAGLDLTMHLETMGPQLHAAAEANGTARSDVEAWQRSLTLAARKLESAWIELERRAYQEMQRWDRVADRVAEWRKPLWPVLAGGGLALGVAAWLGLVFGGYVAPPPWFATVWRAVFDR